MSIIKYFKMKFRGEINIKKLKENGLKVGSNFSYGSGCFIDPSHCFLIKIGDNVVFSSKVHVLAHDASTKKYTGYTKIGLVNICDDVFIGANSTILPNVTIGKGSIVAAGSVVTKSIPPGEVWAGVPAKKIYNVEEYLDKFDLRKSNAIFDKKYTIKNGITNKMKEEMKMALMNDKVGFVE